MPKRSVWWRVIFSLNAKVGFSHFTFEVDTFCYRYYSTHVSPLVRCSTFHASSAINTATEGRPNETGDYYLCLGQMERSIYQRKTPAHGEQYVPSFSRQILFLTLLQEYDVILQNQKNLIFSSFGIWLSKTKVCSWPLHFWQHHITIGHNIVPPCYSISRQSYKVQILQSLARFHATRSPSQSSAWAWSWKYTAYVYYIKELCLVTENKLLRPFPIEVDSNLSIQNSSESCSVRGLFSYVWPL